MTFSFTAASLPLALVLTRLALCPLLVLVALAGGASFGWLLALLLVFGFATDIFDGILARRLGVATPGLRRLDSQVDLCFWLAVLGASAIAYPAVMAEVWPGLALIFGLELAIYALAYLKFRREMSTHAWLSKLWGLLLVLAFTRLLLVGEAGWSFDLMVVAGVISQLDVILIALLLPAWQNDIPSAWHAWQIRRGRPIKRHSLLN